MWTIHYDETGGYDCMTGAYVIEYTPVGGSLLGYVSLVIDLSDFGQDHCGPEVPARARAEAFALTIAAALNAGQVPGVLRRPR